MNFGNTPSGKSEGKRVSNNFLLGAPEPKRTPFLFQKEAEIAPADKNKQNLKSTENDPARENDAGTSSGLQFGQSYEEKSYFLTGNVERVIKWNKILKNRFCVCYEVFACIVSLEDGQLPLQKLMLLRDNKGPILQVVHYLSNDVSGLQSLDFSVGQKLRVVGRMTEPNKLTAICLRLATTAEMAVIQRFCYIGDYAVSRLLGEVENHR